MVNYIIMNPKQKLAYLLVAERDNHQCQLCGSVANDVHHILFRSHGGSDDPRNLICLCRSCHDLAHSDEKKYRTILFDLNSKHYGKINVKDVKK